MGFGCPAWPRTCDAQDHRHDESNHASSGFVVDRRSDRHFFDERDAGAKALREPAAQFMSWRAS